MTSKVAVIVDTVKDKGLAEIYQSMQLKLALLRKQPNNTWEKITPSVLCRDFLVDSHSYALAKKDFSIYQMSFKGSTEQPDWTGAYFLAKFPSKEVKERFLANMAAVLHKVEKDNDFAVTKVIETESETQLVISGSKEWLENALTYSLYSFLLRAMCYEADTDTPMGWVESFSKKKSSDSKYAASVPMGTWKAVFGDIGVLKTKDWCGLDPKKYDVGSVHHNSGFISVFGKHTEISYDTVAKNKHWQEMRAKGLETAYKG